MGKTPLGPLDNNQLGALQSALEDFFLTHADVPEWVTNAHDAIIAEWERREAELTPGDDLPTFVTKVTSGPLKDRTFMVPDELLAGKGWLKDDVREVANRYSRAMAGEIELTRRFGRADMRDQLEQIAQELRGWADGTRSDEALDRAFGEWSN